jgi:predicted ATP-binding protein involved in virulence
VFIQSIQLQNFRSVSSLTIKLSERLNVFVGINGAGKSTILDATAILLSWLANRIKTAGASGRPIKESDIQNNSSSSVLSADLSDESVIIQLGTSKTRPGMSKKEKSFDLSGLNEKIKQFQKDITENNGKTNLPLLAYYPVHRAVLDIPLRIRNQHSFSILETYDESLTSGANFRTFFEWFRNQEDIENENRRYINYLIPPENFEFPDKQLEAVRNALSIFMPNFKNWTVRRRPLQMEVDKDGQTLIVNQLSDGEKCLMAMVGDIARRMALANPLLDNPLHGDGIVLIDEVDLHLHPLWQRIMIPHLLETFPNCQFLISTHSPHVLTHVQPQNIFMLYTEDGKFICEHPQESYGKTSERILEDLMGLETTRPDIVKNALKTLFVRLQDGDIEQAKNDIELLQQEIGEDPELVKARVLIKRKELIGK